MKKVLISFLCAFCWLGLPTLTSAQPTNPKSDYAPTVDSSQLKKPEPVPQTDSSKKGPALRATEMYRTKTARTEVELQSLINELYRIIDYADDDDPEKPKYYGNLALLYWEKAESFYIQAFSNESDEALIAARAAKDDAKVAELEAKRQSLLDAQQEWRRKAIRVYMDIEEKYSDFPKIDMVLFYLGISLNQVGEFDEAFGYFKKLVTQFPGSSYIPDGLVNLGEYYFDQAQFTTAIEFYKRVEKFPDSRVYSYCIYKQAWCFYNLQQYNESFKKFIEVINYQDEMEAKGLTPKLMLKDQALEDVVLAYSHIGNEKQALDFFKKLAPNAYMGLLSDWRSSTSIPTITTKLSTFTNCSSPRSPSPSKSWAISEPSFRPPIRLARRTASLPKWTSWPQPTKPSQRPTPIPPRRNVAPSKPCTSTWPCDSTRNTSPPRRRQR